MIPRTQGETLLQQGVRVGDRICHICARSRQVELSWLVTGVVYSRVPGACWIVRTGPGGAVLAGSVWLRDYVLLSRPEPAIPEPDNATADYAAVGHDV